MHWLSYSHADQALFRDTRLEATWDSLVVPGTLAAFYFEGTGGFVLTRGRPYIIDPRTPLLQTVDLPRPEPRKSHLALAEIHDPAVCSFWPDTEILLTHWQDGRWPSVVRRTMEFQERYSSSATAKFDKYAKLLVEATGKTLPTVPMPPLRIVPPYWAVRGASDPWWDLSNQAIQIALDEFGSARVMPVMATTRDTPIGRFEELLRDLPDDCEAVFCWRGSWDEAAARRADIDGWAATIEAGQQYGVEVSNLYGGALSALMTGIGLAGVNHGVGYSEQRDARRLGETGSPPTRYYMPALRAFVSRASAQPAVDALPVEWSCTCEVCENVKENGVPLIDALSVEDLKRHFLICRSRELDRVRAGLGTELDDLEQVARWLRGRSLPTVVPSGSANRLRDWATALRPHA